jgi:hypothetical protein
MSKRKSRAKSMFVDKIDLVFEDDSDPDLVIELNKPSKNGKPKQDGIAGFQSFADSISTRVSSRAKKTKNIYDPSEYNGPVHKKKREALEAAQNAATLKKQQKTAAVPATPPVVVASPIKVPSKSPVKQPVKTPTKTIKAPVQIAKINTARLKQIVAAADLKKKEVVNESRPVVKPIVVTSQLVRITKPIQLAAAAAVASVPLSPSKDPKRIRKEKLVPKLDYDAPSTSAARVRSPSTSANSEFEKASTVELNDRKIPDVSKWSSSEVYSYFLAQGFEEKDARTFKEQEIDGETLMILRREDLRNLNLRVGVFVKMWNRIVSFQSGSNDISQGWK